MYRVTFGEADQDLGGARTATRGDGTVIGVRAPLAAHEDPVVRVYAGVEDIDAAVAAASDAGAVIAYGPVQQGEAGRFAIVVLGGVQHGFWDRGTNTEAMDAGASSP